MDNFSATYKDGILTLQRYEYIEDDWYIEYDGDLWDVFEIPEAGGLPNHVQTFSNLDDALKLTRKLF